MKKTIKDKERSRSWLRSGKALFVIISILFIIFVGVHEASVRYQQELTCTVCHEMREPIKKWKASGTSKNHNNCAGCHWDDGFMGWLEMNRSALKFLFLHFKRNPDDPIKPLTEPIFLEDGKEPGYWSRVPNHRCYQCHDAKNHKKEDQPKIHEKVIKNIWEKPCMDCHNHEMRNDQKFYKKVVAEENADRTQ